MAKNKSVKILGIMSGTSLDGVDYALCEMTKNAIELKGLWSVSYDNELRKRLMKAATDNLSSYEVCQLHHDLGRFYAKHAPPVKFNYVGLHGQTIFHNPSRKAPATFQLGEPAYLAARFNVPVVNQFRTMDLALGGQGAPLATMFHKHVFGGNKNIDVAVNNLGGISNVTFLPASGKTSPSSRHQKILSFDTGPANILIDLAIHHFTKGKQTFDKEGAFAARGLSSPDLIEKWLKLKFFKKLPPKSTGREEFGEEFFFKALSDCRRKKLSPHDTVATFTDFTAQSLALSYEKFLPRMPSIVILCGGGAQNPTLRIMIRKALNERQFGKLIVVTTTDALGWPAQSIEAAAFALLAFTSMNGLPGNICETTGARKAAVLGQISLAP
jgi:anhydro-N-acetylmuramic acid kinase